jgi:hypothetical protein
LTTLPESEKCEDASTSVPVSDNTPLQSGDRRRSLRELITLARERFGPDAARLKTREELEAALLAGPAALAVPAEVAPPPAPLPAPSAPRPLAPAVVVVRDFFLRKA